MMDSLAQQPELFATCSDTDTTDKLLVTATVPVVERFGWTMFSAVEQKRALQTVDIAAGAVTTVDTVKTFQYHASQRGWLEEQVHKKAISKYVTMEPGEGYAVIILTTKKQELFAPCLDTDMLVMLVATATVPVTERLGICITFAAVERKRTLLIVATAAGGQRHVITCPFRASLK